MTNPLDFSFVTGSAEPESVALKLAAELRRRFGADAASGATVVDVTVRRTQANHRGDVALYRVDVTVTVPAYNAEVSA